MIYFIRAGNHGPIKVGYTNGDPKRRLVDLQVGNHERLVLVASLPGDESTERRLHRTLREHKKRGEWFYPHAVEALLDSESPGWRPEYVCKAELLPIRRRKQMLKIEALFAGARA